MTRMKFKLPSLSDDNSESSYTAQSLFQRHKKNTASEPTKGDSKQSNALPTQKYQNPEEKTSRNSSSHNSIHKHSDIEKVTAATANFNPQVHTKQYENCSTDSTDIQSKQNENNYSSYTKTPSSETLQQSKQGKGEVSASPEKNKIETIPSGALPKPGKSNSMLVSPRQRGNPILKFVRNVPWEYGDIVADYEMASTRCALFLSLRYHNLNPNYIHERLKQLGRTYDLRILLVQIDVKDPYHALKELAKVCILADCTLILAWSQEEAGRYLETFKAFENKPPDLIMERTEGNYLAKVTDTFTSAKKVNKTDAATLITTFGSVENVILASEEDLSLCPGFGPQKAKRLHDVFHEPFLKSKKRKLETTKEKNPAESTSPKKSPQKGKLTPKKSTLEKS